MDGEPYKETPNSPKANAQAFTFNAKHGLYSLPKANTEAFTLNAKHGLDGTPKATLERTTELAESNRTGFYAQCEAWLIQFAES
jgi:hypothetical protein